MNIRKVDINRKIVDVLDIRDVDTNSIEQLAEDGVVVDMGGILYPIRTNKLQGEVGVVYNKEYNVFEYTDPIESETEEYSSNKIIDFNKPTIDGFLESMKQYGATENNILTSDGDKFVPNINENDEAEMVALKKAVIAKNIDINNYSDRFPQFQNDKRLFNGNTISMPKFKAFIKNLDLSATLVITDRHKDVSNPMGTTITVDLLNGGDLSYE